MRVRAVGVSLVLIAGLMAGLGGPLGLMSGAGAAQPTGIVASLLSASTSPSSSPSKAPSKSPSPSASKAPSKSPSPSASKSPSKSPSSSPSPTPKTGNYRPTSGPLFNDPYGRAPYKASTIRDDAVKSINSAPRGSVIRMAMFNFRSKNYLQALIKAHKRGVQIQFLMCACNDTKADANPQPKQLRTELSKGNAGLPAGKRSWVRECKGACRGSAGISHFKFITFSGVGRTKTVHDVVMYGSNNATEIAVYRQWNDWYTFTRDPRMFHVVNTIFAQASRDKAVKNGYVKANFSGYNPASSMWFYPYTGAAAKGDPVVNKLNNIRCTGTTLKFLHGHTRIRVAQDAIAGPRGISIAQKLASLEGQGCDIKIVYTLIGQHVYNILHRAGIKTVHFAYDRNGDGEYDMYLHAKDLAVEGTYGGNKRAYVTWNGTANWTPLPMQSDELVAEIHNKKTTSAYTEWINWLLRHRPSWWPANSSAPPTSDVDGRARPGAKRVDPYAAIRGDL